MELFELLIIPLAGIVLWVCTLGPRLDKIEKEL